MQYLSELILFHLFIMSSNNHSNSVINHTQLNHDIRQLYVNNHRWLVQWLSKKLGCVHDAADVAQDAFVKLAHIESLASIHTPRAFLTTTAKRLIIDLARKRQIETRYLELLALQQGHLVEAPAEQIQQAIEKLDEVTKLLQGLPDKVSRAFLMCRLDGLSYEEIAQELGVSTSMVKQYIAKAMLHCYHASYTAP